jgi:hypothetical protein
MSKSERVEFWEEAHRKTIAELFEQGLLHTWAYKYHIRRGGIRSQSPVIPLCPEHHRGNTGIHGMGRKAFERNYETTEESLLQIVNEILQSRG